MPGALRQYIQHIAALSDEEFEYILSCFDPVIADKGEILLQQDHVCQHLYFVKQGAIRMYSIRESGEETTRYITTEGQMGTALVSFMNHQPSFEAIQAIEKSPSSVFLTPDFMSWCVKYLPGKNCILSSWNGHWNTIFSGSKPFCSWMPPPDTIGFVRRTLNLYNVFR